ncbi:ABC transporter ATP-binding protein [Celeribacter baekdonensis]|jgi:branched-chain amino acid transport system ATP-binding protein|uniref:ABC transporter ATP-binding protein n=1 Tax=Celeribacter baekdonensis TaxID=875171 RepID=A0A2R4M1S3_9RHOB|nr:ABC transporter ATP-binding protein [Celeribacter baekdonensis]AVW91096.1 ABC transporter ATP-binding protein [Celeribacter baekdonensis]
MSILSLQNVSKSFGALKVTDDVSFDLAAGEALGIIGPNGAGKSTLFNLITGNIAVDQGTITLDGRDVTRQPPMARVAAGIGRSFQIPQPFTHLSVFENLLVAANFGGGHHGSEAGDFAMDILSRTGLAAEADLVSGGLSLLQRKRLELARAMATSPKVILLDEIAGGLTEGECHALVDTIKGIHAEGTAIIWIEHVLHALNSVVERLMVLDFGKNLMIGEPSVVMEAPQVKEIYLGIEI